MLIRLPDSWPHGLVAVLAMLVLALLDLGGAFAAKEAVLRRSMPMAAVGVTLFVLLFWVYASSLRYADLARSRSVGSSCCRSVWCSWIGSVTRRRSLVGSGPPWWW
jgi:hypothetical protein